MATPSRISKGKLSKITCRICFKEVVKQNYRLHLKVAHPSEDSNDLRQKGVQTIQFGFLKKSLIPEITEPEITEPEEQNSEDCSVRKTVQRHRSRSPLHATCSLNSGCKDDSDDEWVVLFKRFKKLITAMSGTIVVNLPKSSSNIENIKKVFNILEVLLPSTSNIKQSIETLKDAVPHLQSLVSNKGDEKDIDISESSDIDIVLKTANSIKSLLDLFPVLKCNKKEIVCECGSILTLHENEDLDGNQSRKFRNFKITLKKHFISHSHVAYVKHEDKKQQNKSKSEEKNSKIGTYLASMAYFNYKMKRPDTDYELQVCLHSSLGTDLGNTNHSRKFSAKLLKHVAAAVSEKVKAYFNNVLPQTGYKPPAKIVADKVTWKHRTQQLVGVITVVPDSRKPIQAFVLGAPVVKEGHRGVDIAANILSVTEGTIAAEQYRGIAADGQYFKLGVHKALDQHYGRDGHHDWDPMHRAGLIDTHLRNICRKDFNAKWLNDLTTTISDTFRIFNIGKEFEHLMLTCEQLAKEGFEIQFKLPAFYSNTRFANHVSKVYSSFLSDFPGIARSLEESMASLRNGTSKDKATAQKYAAISNKIINSNFVFSLCGLVDIYKLFGQITILLQTVNMLPHIKYDLFVQHSHLLENMIDCINHESCKGCTSQIVPDVVEGEASSSDDSEFEETHNRVKETNKKESNCLWPTFHKAVISYKKDGLIKGIPMGQSAPEQIPTRVGTNINLTEKGRDSLKACVIRIEEVSKYILKGLVNDVYDTDDVKMISAIRQILSLKKTASECAADGFLHVFNLTSSTFINACEQINIHEKRLVKEEELKSQYRLFLKAIECQAPHLVEMTDIEIFAYILCSENKIFNECEYVIHMLVSAAITKSVESIVESWGSSMELASSKTRNISQERLQNELQIIVNGPDVSCSKPIIQEALRRLNCESKSGNVLFLRKSSKHTVKDRILKQAQNECVPFMK